MRTTITLDPDVDKAVRARVRKTGKPMKTVLNDALRRGLSARPADAEAAFNQPTFDLGRPLIDLLKANSLASELEDAETLLRYTKINAAS